MRKATILSLYPDNLISGVTRVPSARGQKIFLRPYQQKLQSSKWKVDTKARQTKKFTVYYFCYFSK